MIEDLKKELERLNSIQEIFTSDNKRIENKLNELHKRKNSLTQMYNPSKVEALSEKYRKHAKDEEELKRIIYEYQLAIDYLKSRHNSILSNQSLYHSPSSREMGSFDMDNIEKELAEEQGNLSYQRERLKKFTNIFSVLQNIKKDVAQQIEQKKFVVEKGVRGLDDLIDRLEFLRDLELLANKILEKVHYFDEIEFEERKTVECWNHHLNTIGRKNRIEKRAFLKRDEKGTWEEMNEKVVRNDLESKDEWFKGFLEVFNHEKSMGFVFVLLVFLIVLVL
jgi:hypothetical protein